MADLLRAYLVVGTDELKRDRTVARLKAHLDPGLADFNLDELTASADMQGPELVASAQTMQYSPSTIVVNAPQARYLYHGVKMSDPNGGGPYPIRDETGRVVTFRYRKGAHPVPTGIPLQFTHTTNPLAGPYWDRTLVQNEGAQISQEVAEYVRRLKR